ncbi:aldehyde dehydrogenase family protein [Streptomyces sp. NPDC001817]|uniref:aldehyde dehydrogenase family protein n=1 Tax=Streptomyces sp. NPDC001817 TaxID=3154398 RepID=UPI00331D8E6E
MPHPGHGAGRPREGAGHAGRRSDRELNQALVRAPEIGCVSFVGGRDTGADVATAVAGLGKRHILEQEGLTPGASGASRAGSGSPP